MPDKTTSLSITFVDTSGNAPHDFADIDLRHLRLDTKLSKRGISTSSILKVTNLDATEGGVYRLDVSPLRHRSALQFVTVQPGRNISVRIVLLVRPDKVTAVTFPPYELLPGIIQKVLENGSVEGAESLRGHGLFDSFDDIQRAGLLNIFAKMSASRFDSGKTVAEFIESLLRVRGDRFFASVAVDLRDRVKSSQASGLFHEVPGGLHTPPPGFHLVDSYKTRDLFGNLQVTFFCKDGSTEYIVDADIDDAQGIEHITQVADHLITGTDTNPYDIHEILMETQRIDPGYGIIV